MCLSAYLEVPAVAQDWKRSALFPFPKKGSSKDCSNHQTVALVSHASKITLKISHARLQHCSNQELPDIHAEFRKGKGTRDQVANILWIISKQGNSRKTSTSLSLTVLKPLTVWIITNYGKLLKKWEYQTILLISWEACMWVKKEQLEPCMEQLTSSGLSKEYNRAVCRHPVCLTYMLSTS